MNMIRKICANCKSDAVQWDATASWDEAKQEFVLDAVMENSWCTTCGRECHVEETLVPLRIKWNGGLLGILCLRCSSIIKIGRDFTPEEMDHLFKENIMPAYLCDKCKIETNENI